LKTARFLTSVSIITCFFNGVDPDQCGITAFYVRPLKSVGFQRLGLCHRILQKDFSAITFGGGSGCIGIRRRSSCNSGTKQKMKPMYRAAGLCAAILLGVSIASVWAQDSKDRTVEQYTCKDIMRESGANRDVAIVFRALVLQGHVIRS